MPTGNTPTVSLKQLASMRATTTASLPDECSIIRDVEVKNQSGGLTKTPQVVHSGVPCRFQLFRVPLMEQLVVDRTLAESKTRWAFVFPSNTDITIKDRIKITASSGVPEDGHTYVVAAPMHPSSWDTADEWLCELLL